MGFIPSSRVRAALLGVCASLASACVAETAEEVVVGSGNVDVLSVEAVLVERVAIVLPFSTRVHNGEAGRLVARGEDNLLAQISVREVSPGAWKISAPLDLAFEQHSDIELQIPYFQMTELRIDADHVELADDPAARMAGREVLQVGQ